MGLKIAPVWGLLIVLCAGTLASAARIYAPPYLWNRGIASKTNPRDIADTYLGMRYRDDGTLDSNGRFTTFNHPDSIYSTPGLNCSGIVLSISRFLFDRNFTLTEAERDRQGNSGPGAPYGKDWDFGLDLILNITDGVPRRILSPDGTEIPLDDADGMVLRGFDLHDVAAWHSVLRQMRPGRVYFGSISKPTRKKGYKLLHYHVVLMIPDEKGGVWLYHSTRRSHVHRINLNTRQGLRRLMGQFRDSREGPKKILVLEAMLPGTQLAAANNRGEMSGGAAEPPKAKEEVNSAAVKKLDNLRSGKGGGSPTKQADAAPLPAEPPAANKPEAPLANRPKSPNLVINHLSGKVYNYIPDLVTHIPRFSDKEKSGIAFWFRGRSESPRDLKLLVRGPEGDLTYNGKIPAKGGRLEVVYPRDFGKRESGPARLGRYAMIAKVDGRDWLADIFEVAVPREAEPSIVKVSVPSTVRSGQTFTMEVLAENKGAESDYGGITVSCPDPSGLKLLSAKPGRIYGRGSTVLSVTSDKIRTRVPMAERWIELWGEKKPYEMQVRIRAGRPGTYPLYVRCALRGVNVKSNVVLMDPPSADTIDQQGFPVQVHMVTVR
jgi:hypothetical protein